MQKLNDTNPFGGRPMVIDYWMSNESRKKEK